MRRRVESCEYGVQLTSNPEALECGALMVAQLPCLLHQQVDNWLETGHAASEVITVALFTSWRLLHTCGDINNSSGHVVIHSMIFIENAWSGPPMMTRLEDAS